MVVKPSLTKMTDLRPSRMPPRRIAAPLSARHHDLVPNLLDCRGGVIRVALLELVARLVVEAPPLEVLDRADQARAVAGERQAGDRRQRIHDRDHVRGSELVLDELDERLAHGHVVAAADVVVVEQDHEQTNIRPLRLPLLVEERADLARRRTVDLLSRRIVDPDDRERLDDLRLAVFLDSELVLLEVEYRVALRSLTIASTRT